MNCVLFSSTADLACSIEACFILLESVLELPQAAKNNTVKTKANP
jgi:hypothetical protein